MNTKEEQNIRKHKTKGLRISVVIHLGLLVLALVPLITGGSVTANEEVMIIPVDFRAAEGQPQKSLQAQAMEQRKAVHPAAVEGKKVDQPVPADNTFTEPRLETIQATGEEFTVETPEENTVSADQESAIEDADKPETGGAAEAPEAGDARGSDPAGDDAWKAGLEGDGILTRRIVYREDITQVAEQDGVIAINVCVNRGGKVSAAKYNEDHTTITDKGLIRKALNIVSGYRFESDAGAPKKECGMLTFIFDVDWDNGGKLATID